MPHNALLAGGFESAISTSKLVVGLLDIHGNENACAGKHFDNCLMGMPDSVVDGAGKFRFCRRFVDIHVALVGRNALQESEQSRDVSVWPATSPSTRVAGSSPRRCTFNSCQCRCSPDAAFLERLEAR